MYLPYFRGRQNELLCLRELLNSGKLGENILPVIEPVRYNSTFFKTIKQFIEKERDIIVVNNPNVGNYDNEYREMRAKLKDPKDAKNKDKIEKTLKEYSEILDNPHVIFGYINNNSVVKDILDGTINVADKVLINMEKGDYSYYADYGENLDSRLTLIPKDEDFKDEVLGNTVILEDCYNKARRNIDYIDKPDDFFSKNHLIFEKRGYQGFSDYSIVGNGFEESGFAPLAVAIHIVYFGDKRELRVHHFVSDSNENISDPARKFEEAMRKLVEWQGVAPIQMTLGLKALIGCYESGKFPGLGVIKKYSLMHHLELITSYLGG